MSYIYALADEKGIRYIGKSIDPEKRLKQHHREIRNGKNKNPYFCDWFSKTEKPFLIILEYAGDNWPEREKFWIKRFSEINGKLITNIHEGGGGGATMTGRKHTPETIRKMRKAALENRENRVKAGKSRKNKTSWNKGQKMPPEYGRRVSEGIKRNNPNGRVSWNKDKKTPKETREKISKNKKAYYSDPRNRKAQSERTKRWWDKKKGR